MKFRILSLLLVATMTLSLTACESSPWGTWGTKQTIGTASGAAIGGILGSRVGGGSGQLWATGAGALLGAFVGSSIGESLDRADQQYHTQAAEQAYNAPLNQSIEWHNPESGNRGSVTPVREGREQSTGNLCRRYKQTIVVDGQTETAFGTACQSEDGTWELVNG